MDNTNNCMVSVFCTTYNQKKYIAQCLESMVNQKTSFPYEIIVRDDASTDGTSEIIRELHRKYPDRIVPFIQPENLFQQGLERISFEQMFKMSRGKYIAVCDGDDFWTDENKLQKQVDFMESHPDYSMCGHAAYFAREDGTLRKDRFFSLSMGSGDLTIEEIISKWAMATTSLMYRKSCRTDIIFPFRGNCVNDDYAMMVYMALKGKVYYSDELMGAYRQSSNGSISQRLLNDKEYLVKYSTEFVQMLDRINQYTNGAYSDLIEKQKRITIFDMYLNLGDSKNLKKYKDVYQTACRTTKIRYILCVYCNLLYKPAYSAYLRLRKK